RRRPCAVERLAVLGGGAVGRAPQARGSGLPYPSTRREWLAAERDSRCVRMEGDAMAPLVCDGAVVAFSEAEEPPDDLEGKLVVAWAGGRPLVRWFQRSGRFALLRAENPEAEPEVVLLDLVGPSEQRCFRRVLWISTPH